MTRLHQSREQNRYRKRGMFFDVFMGVKFIPLTRGVTEWRRVLKMSRYVTTCDVIEYDVIVLSDIV